MDTHSRGLTTILDGQAKGESRVYQAGFIYQEVFEVKKIRTAALAVALATAAVAAPLSGAIPGAEFIAHIAYACGQYGRHGSNC